MKRIIVYLLIAIGVFLLVKMLTPVDVSKNNSVAVTGTVVRVESSGTFDLVIILKDDNKTYYINRGLEKKFKLVELSQRILQKPVTIFCAKHWTPLDPLGSMKHVTALMLENDTLYSEF